MTRHRIISHLAQATHDVGYIFIEEMKTVFKDEGVIIFFFVVPLLYPLLYSWIYNNELVTDVPTVVVDDSHSFLSRKFIRKLDATQGVKVIACANSIEEAREFMRRQDCRGIVNIPKDFASNIYKGIQTHVSVFIDMSGMLYYKALAISTTDVSLAMGAEIQVMKMSNYTARDDELNTAPLTFESISLFNPATGYGSYLLPGVLMLIIQQTLLLGIGLSAGTARENNKYKKLATIEERYNGMYRIIFGKGLCYFLLYAIISSYILLVVPHIFGFIQIGLPNDIIGIVLPYVLACIFFGMTVSCLIRYRENVILFIVFTSVPLLFLSGILWPASAISGTWKAISYLFPSTFGVNGFVKINSMGATLQEVYPEYVALWIQTAVYFLIACFVYRREIKKSKKITITRLETIRKENQI
ncbi:MAG: ABC transporter permease [Bacteroidaceae bacterium]|nr:ABC transporter permease [Bacteroidaceae bacterium]